MPLVIAIECTCCARRTLPIAVNFGDELDERLRELAAETRAEKWERLRARMWYCPECSRIARERDLPTRVKGGR